MLRGGSMIRDAVSAVLGLCHAQMVCIWLRCAGRVHVFTLRRRIYAFPHDFRARICIGIGCVYLLRSSLTAAITAP